MSSKIIYVIYPENNHTLSLYCIQAKLGQEFIQCICIVRLDGFHKESTVRGFIILLYNKLAFESEIGP